MIAANYTEFRTGLKNYLDNVEFNNETLIIKRGSGKGTVPVASQYGAIFAITVRVGFCAIAV